MLARFIVEYLEQMTKVLLLGRVTSTISVSPKFTYTAGLAKGIGQGNSLEGFLAIIFMLVRDAG